MLAPPSAIRAYAILTCAVVATFGGDPPDTQWGERVLDCRMSASAAKQVYLPSERITVSTTVKNVGNDMAYVLLAGRPMMFRVEIIGPDGKEVQLTPEGRRRAATPDFGSANLSRLAAGETSTIDYSDLNLIYDMASPGEYAVTLIRRVYNDEEPAGKPIRSNPLQLTITEKVAATQPATDRSPTTQPSR
jgi:hypothetical protein